MDKPFYDFKILDEALRFEFESVGGQKNIKKIIRYAETDIANLYNLSMVDLLDNGLESDISVSNNQDMEMILATVFQTVGTFLRINPARQVFFMGSTPTRTRLYQMAINHELNEASKLFEIKGLTDDGFELFIANKTYQAFVIRLK